MDATPTVSGVFAQQSWIVEIDADGDAANGYERLVMVDGRDALVEVWAITAGKTGLPGDIADTFVASYPISTHARAVTDGSDDFFVDFAVPWADLGFGPDPLRFVAGARADEAPQLTTGSAGDIAGFGGSDTPTVAEAASDSLTCGTDGCSTPPVNTEADVASDLSGPRSTSTGRTLRYRAAVSNLGPEAAHGVVLDVTLPSGAAFSSISAKSWTCSTPAIGAAGTISCSLPGTPAAGTTIRLTVTGTTAASSGDAINVTATVTSACDDATPANDVASVVTQVR